MKEWMKKLRNVASKAKPLEREENLHQLFDRRLPVKMWYPGSVLLQRGEPGSTVKITQKHILSNLSGLKKLEKIVSKSRESLVTESVEMEAG